MIEHFKTIADNTELPIILYNVPGRTGVDMFPETIAELAKHPLIVGCKEATGDNLRVQQIQKLCGENFLLYSGEDGEAMDFTLQGGHGVISVSANICPKAVHDIMSMAYKKCNEKGAIDLNNLINPIHKNLFCQSNPIPVKWALWRMGLIERNIRAPLTWMEDQYIPQLEKAIKGLLG